MDLKAAITKQVKQAAGQIEQPAGAVMAFRSHIEGKNADVIVWPDRVEWIRTRFGGRADTNTISLKAITGVKTHKSTLTYTEVEVQAGASTVTMRVPKAQAAELRRVLMPQS